MPRHAPFIVQAVVRLKSETDRAELDRVVEDLSKNDNRLAVVEGAEGQPTIVKATSLGLLTAASNSLRSEFKILAPSVVFCRTLTKAARVRFTHKKAKGDGTGEFADLTIAFEPLPAGTGEMFANDLVSPLPLDNRFVAAIGKGLADAAGSGVQFVDFKARLIDAKYHELDSTPDAFELAARGAFHDLRTSNPGLVYVEPLMKVEILTPDEFVGSVIGLVNSMRGVVLHAESPREWTQRLVFMVPLANMLDFATDLAALTRGRASYMMQFERYERVPMDHIPGDDDPRFPGAMGARVA